MSWRGEAGGIAAANMDHDVIMTPGSGGMYLDQYEGDYKIEPVTIGGFASIEKYITTIRFPIRWLLQAKASM